MSRRFIYGEGHADRPILGFLAAYAIAWLIFAIAVQTARRGSFPTGWVVVVAVVARLILVPSQLIQEDDPYRYVLDGQVTLHGGNPYLLAPQDVEPMATGGLADALRTPGSALALSRISYPNIPTIYPPAAQWAFAAGAWLSGWDWRGQRWVFLAVDFLVVAILAFRQTRPGSAHGNILLYAWNPLVLKEVANSAHLDVLVGLFLILAWLSALRDRDRQDARWAAISGGALGMAALSKIYPLVFFPAFLVSFYRRAGQRRAAIFSAAVAMVCAAGFLPFLRDGWEPVTAGLLVYAREWRMNEGAFSWLALATSQARLISALLIGSTALLVPWTLNDTPGALCRSLQWISLLWFLLIPAPFPWYAVPLAALAALNADTGPAKVCVLLSGVVCLYYLSFYFEYHSLGEVWWLVTRTIEHGSIWAAMAWLGWKTWQGASPKWLGRP